MTRKAFLAEQANRVVEFHASNLLRDGVIPRAGWAYPRRFLLIAAKIPPAIAEPLSRFSKEIASRVSGTMTFDMHDVHATIATVLYTEELAKLITSEDIGTLLIDPVRIAICRWNAMATERLQIEYTHLMVNSNSAIVWPSRPDILFDLRRLILEEIYWAFSQIPVLADIKVKESWGPGHVTLARFQTALAPSQLDHRAITEVFEQWSPTGTFGIPEVELSEVTAYGLGFELDPIATFALHPA